MRLTWDATGERFYETGVRNGVVYPVVNNAYPVGYAWNGLTGVTENPSGADSNPQYADDIKYLNLISKEEFGATITAFTYPDEFANCDGSAEPVPGVRIGQQTRKMFGLCYRTSIGNDTEGVDHAYKLHLIYGALASPSEKAYQTQNESPEAIEFSWEVTTTPVTVSGYKPTASLTIDSRDFSSAKMAAIEDVLYGDNSNDARLPLPDEVISIMGESVFEIVLDKANVSVTVGSTVKLNATTSPAGKTVTWASSDGTKASVANGVVTGVAATTAGSPVTITASFTESGVTYSDTCRVTVNAAS